MEKVIEFSPHELKAPFFLRCAALFIDYMLLIMLPAFWLVISKFVGDTSVSSGISGTAWLFVLLAWVINFLALPLLRGQTIGKMMAGLTILKTDGTPIRLGHIILRNVLGYLLTLLTLGLGFLISAINTSGRSLHDYLAGTVVVHGRKKLT
ncbi:MAG: RDD family protein [Pyrinomonadaceae bacterium]